MYRRQVLLFTLGSASVSGCLQPPIDPGGNGSDRVTIQIVDRTSQPEIPITYDATLIQSVATKDQPGRLRISITNEGDELIALGEERAIKFHHVTSADGMLYLFPAGEETWSGPVDPGCWQLTEPVAIPEYYGIETIPAGMTLSADCFVYGHPDLSPGSCLLDGDHDVETRGTAGDSEDAVVEGDDQSEFQWGLTLRIEK